MLLLPHIICLTITLELLVTCTYLLGLDNPHDSKCRCYCVAQSSWYYEWEKCGDLQKLTYLRTGLNDANIKIQGPTLSWFYSRVSSILHYPCCLEIFVQSKVLLVHLSFHETTYSLLNVFIALEWMISNTTTVSSFIRLIVMYGNSVQTETLSIASLSEQWSAGSIVFTCCYCWMQC